MTRYAWSVPPVWGLAVFFAVLIGVVAGPAFLTWSGIAMGALVLVAGAIQLGVQRKEGFVARLSASVAGSFVVLLVTSIVLASIYPDAITSLISLD